MVRVQAIIGSLRDTFTPPAAFPSVEEAAYLSDFGARFARPRRAAAVIGLLLWTAFLWWDFYHQRTNSAAFTPAILQQVLLWRCVGIAALLAMVALTLHERFAGDRYAHLILLGGVLIAALALTAMVVAVPSPLDYIYYFVGLYLVLIFMFGFLHLRARPILYCMLLMFAGLIAVQLGALGAVSPQLMAPVHFKPAMFYFASTCVIGFGICVTFERYARQQYAHERQLASAQRANTLRLEALVLAKERERELAHQSRDWMEALAQARERESTRARQASCDKSRFLASAAHDLRQPMFGLSLSLEALRLAVAGGDADETHRLLLLSQQSARIMSNTFNAVLDLSKLESGLLAAQLSHFDVNELIGEVVHSLSAYASSKRTQLRTRLPDTTAVPVHSDRLWLGMVLRNLISNGIKYRSATRADAAAVLIGVVRLGNRIRVDVVDNGIGIPPAQWQRIFEPFVQLNNKERDRENGLGLGLSIVQAIIARLDQHGLELKSIPGRGTRFSIDIPNGLIDAQRLAPPANACVDGGSVNGAYVILVEDDPLVRAAMSAMFLQWGMLIDVADGVERFTALLGSMERYPDLIVSDYRLSNDHTARDIVAALGHHMASMRSSHLVPVLIISGEESPAGWAEDSGAAAMLVKPVHPDALRDAILALLQPARGQHGP